MKEITIGGNMKTQDAISHFGSRKKLAEALGITDVSAIAHWGAYVPWSRQHQLQVITCGRLIADPVRRKANV